MKKLSPTSLIFNSRNWIDLKRKIEKFNQTDQGEYFERFCIYLLKTNPIFLPTINNVWSFRDRNIPNHVLNYLNLEPEDEGIDILLETKDKKYTAIQCKFHSNELHSLSRKELSTFFDMSFVIGKNINDAITISNTNKYSYKFNKLKYPKDKISFLLNDFITENETEKFNNIKNLILNKKVFYAPTDPAKYQLKTINKVSKLLKSYDRGKIIYPCGTGKSLIGFWLAKKIKAKNIIISVPSLALINQLFNTWARESLAINWKIKWRAICSDEKSTEIDSDDVSMQLAEIPVKTLKQKDEIKDWLSSKSKETKVTFITYHSIKKITQIKKNIFDLGIIDEAHRTVGGKDNSFSKILFDDQVKIKKRIFMTATQKFYIGKSKKVSGMEDKSLYGDYKEDGVFDEITFSEAIKLKRPDGSNALTDYEIVHLIIGANSIKNILFVKPDPQVAKRIKWNKEAEASILIGGLAFKKAIKKFKIKNTIGFSNGIDRSILFKDQVDILNKLYKPITKNYHISSRNSTSFRKSIIKSFAQNKNSLITNARCLHEGVDIPKVDSIIFADPKTSTIDVVQSAGRALRPFRGKKLGYIIVPTLLEKGDSEKSRVEKAYENLMQVITSMGSIDGRIIDYYDSVANGKKFKGRVPVNTKVLDSISIDINNFNKNVGIKLYQRLNNLRGIYYTKDEVLKWIKLFRKKYKLFPAHTTGRLGHHHLKENECIDKDGITWRKIDDDFRHARGIFTGGSLSKFIGLNFPGENKYRKIFKNKKIDKKLLKKIIDNYYSIHKKYPDRYDKTIIKETGKDFVALASSLAWQRKKDKKTLTLAMLMHKYYGEESFYSKDKIDDKIIKKYLLDFLKSNKRIPSNNDFIITEKGRKIQFSTLDASIRKGYLHYKGKENLQSLKKKVFKDILNPDFSRKKIVNYLIEYFNKFKKIPSDKDRFMVNDYEDMSFRTLSNIIKKKKHKYDGKEKTIGEIKLNIFGYKRDDDYKKLIKSKKIKPLKF